MKILSTILATYRSWQFKRRIHIARARAAVIVDRRRREFWSAAYAVNAWPTTGATGNGNAAAGQYVANGTGTTLLWGTNNILGANTPIGFLTVTKVSERTIVAYKDNLPNGDGLTAGQVIGIDGILYDIEVRDDVNQVTSALTVGQRIYVLDNGGLVPGGARDAQYSGIITEHDWDTAPRTPAGRRLAVEKYLLIT